MPDTESTQVMEDCNEKGTLSANLMDVNEVNHLVAEDDYDEEEDVDFNPFLKETSSPEASSSLSSDEEGVGVGVSVGDNVLFSSACNDIQECDGREEVVMQSQVFQKGKESENGFVGTPSKRKSVSTSGDPSAMGGDEFVDDSGILADPLHPRSDAMDVDDEDAICRRTRARYSLADFSLDELENFLQETDDEDVQNVDDEQEYRKFLAAVLQGEENGGQSLQENGNADDDDDEDSDADFELEIEEALNDSDLDETILRNKNRAPRAGSRPKPQQSNHNKMFLGQSNRALRPLVPLIPNAVYPSSPSLDLPGPLTSSFNHFPPSSQTGPASFTPHQIGQLHCLIHEHIQLLVQVFSLCVLDPSRQLIADETRRLISEMVHKREEALSWRRVPYPDFCFRPPYIHPSVSDGLPKCHPPPFPVDSFSSGQQKEAIDTISLSQSSSPSGGTCNDGAISKDSFWVPQVSGPVLSILDAAPLSLVGSYMDDVSKAVKEYKKRHIEAPYESPSEKRPLFPLFNVPRSPAENGEALRGSTSQGSTAGSPSLNIHPPPKKSLAASLVESTKKQSIAFAPKEIVTAAQRFFPLFNSALYPHKPPHVAVVNRVLFTDTEDELLAMGMMEYNTDWKAIQQRFLPCKSKHQIFVRQKNRCSSKAPENPIKAVRRMKTSPLTAEEMAHIHKGLKVFRLDWTSVWKFLVPYRDPSLLPRQWRIAIGTQKSYKSDAAKKEKRHLYEMRKRLGKAAALANWQAASEKEDNLDNNAAEGNNSENDNMEDEDEAYVHEAFLADWRPGNSKFISSELPPSSIDRRDTQPAILLPRDDSYASKKPASDLYGGLCPNNREFLSLNPPHLQNVSQFTHVRYSTAYTMAPNHSNPVYLSNSSNSQVTLRPRRVRRKKDAQLVKLAPDLPPVNLPPSVRVISHSAFKSYQCATSHPTKISSSRTETENLVPRFLADGAKSGMTVSVNSRNKGNTSSQSAANLCPEDPRVTDRFAKEDNSADMDLQMHPLLLQPPEDGLSPYGPANSTACPPNTFNFIAGNQLQANFSHFCKPSDAGSTVNGFYTSLSSKSPSKSCAIDFHPLLQRKDDADFAQLRISSGSAMTEPHATSGTQPTTSVPASPKEMGNELDLEIHLCSTSRKEKVTNDSKVTQCEYNGSRNGLLNFGIIKETNKAKNSSQGRNNLPTASVVASPSNHRHLPRDNTLVLSNNLCRMGDITGDRSLPEIVMEQEELSDSEEENGEEVEFECEDMDDSEREESDCE